MADPEILEQGGGVTDERTCRPWQGGGCGKLGDAEGDALQSTCPEAIL